MFDQTYYDVKKQKLSQRAEQDKIDFINTVLNSSDKFRKDFMSISEELKDIDIWIETNKAKVEEVETKPKK